MKKPTNGEACKGDDSKPEKAIPQLKNEDSQPITASTWKANEPKPAPAPETEEAAPPKPVVRDHHAKKPDAMKHDEAAKPDKAEA